MDMNRDNDNLENFFRKGLSEENDFLSGDWDMPSDAVWEGIEQALPAKRRMIPFIPVISLAPIRRLKWASAASVLLLLSAYMAYHAQQEIGALQQQVAIQSNQLEDLQNNSNNNFTFSSVASNGNSIGDKMDAFLANVKETFISTEKKKSSLISENDYKTYFTKTLILPIHNNKITLSDNGATALPSSMKTVGLKPNDFSWTPAAVALPVKETWSIIPAAPTEKRNFYAGIFTGPSRWKTNVDSKISDAVVVKGKVIKESGIETGVKVGWQINDHLSLETGISQVKNSRTVAQEISYNFDPENENLKRDGMLISSYDSKINTSFGNTEIALEVARDPEQAIVPGTSFDVAFNNEVTTKLIQVPLTARYGLQKGKLNVSLSAGVLLSFLQDHYINLPKQVIVDKARLMKEQPRLKDQNTNLNKMHYAVQGGVQLAYQPTTTVELYVAPTVAKGLTPVAESEETTATLAQVGLTAGVNLRF